MCSTCFSKQFSDKFPDEISITNLPNLCFKGLSPPIKPFEGPNKLPKIPGSRTSGGDRSLGGSPLGNSPGTYLLKEYPGM